MAKAMKTCNRCGVGGLLWANEGGQWRLTQGNGERHVCALPDDVPLEVVEAASGGEEQTLGTDRAQTTSKNEAKGQATIAQWSEALEKVLRGGNEGDGLAAATEQMLREAAKQGAAASRNQVRGAQKAETQQVIQDIQKAAQEVAQKAAQEAKEELKEELQRLTQPTVTEIKIPHRDLTIEVNSSEEHKQYAALMKLVLLGTNVFLPGQAGSGKTTAAIHIARDLKKVFQRDDYEFLTISVTEMTSESKLGGFFDAQGRLINTAFRRAYTEGHLFLLDEADAGNPNVLAFANMALSNGRAAFADGIYPMHEHFRCIVAGNTFGQGGSLIYVGRNALDGAFLDRFYFLPWEVDEQLEMRVSRGYDVGNKEIPKWVGWVQSIRSKLNSMGPTAPHIVISPRASMVGSKLLAAGVHTSFTDPKLREALVWRGAKAEVRRKLGE